MLLKKLRLNIFALASLSILFTGCIENTTDLSDFSALYSYYEKFEEPSGVQSHFYEEMNFHSDGTFDAIMKNTRTNENEAINAIEGQEYNSIINKISTVGTYTQDEIGYTLYFTTITTENSFLFEGESCYETLTTIQSDNSEPFQMGFGELNSWNGLSDPLNECYK